MRMSTDTKALADISRKLKNSPDLVKSFVPVFKQATNEYKAVAFQQAPRSKGIENGQLAESIAVRFGKAENLEATVGILDKSCPYAKFVYFGTRDSAKPIRPKTKKALFFQPKGGGDFIFRGSAKHKGQRANPFLMLSWDSNYGNFVKTLGDGFKMLLEKEIET